MRHGKVRGKLGRTASHRKAMVALGVASLIKKGRIATTLAKAKVLSRVADRAVTLAKREDLHARRQALALVRDRAAVAKLFSEIGPRFTGRNGGYTRVLRIHPRRGDGAEAAMIEFTPSPEEGTGAAKGKKKAKKKK